ncbi:MAG: outer membrane protein transport protein [Rhodocyclaceae bacterium]
MKRNQERPASALRALPVLVAAAFSGACLASGFQLVEQNASGLGNAYAGTAAVAQDASTIFFNPAGMTLLPQGKSFALGVDAIQPSATFHNGGSVPATVVGVPALTRPLGGEGGDAGDLAFVPHGYFAMSLNPNLSIGFGVSAPFGLKTEYTPDWMGRFLAIKSDVKTVNLNPSVAYKVSDKLSLGLGVNYQKIDAELTNMVNLGASETLATIQGDDTGWGYNLGALFQPSASTRIGLAYRSEIKYHVTGNISAPAPVPLLNQPVTLDIKLPDTFTLSAVQQLNDRWEMLGDLSWTGWAKIPELRILTSTGATLSVTQENWRNTWRVAFGGNYKWNDQAKLRFGLAYDQTPVKDEFRTPRLPDSNRFWVALGAQYKPAKQSAIDVGYTHIFIKDGSINDNGGVTVPPTKGTLNGTYKNHVDILGVQYSQSF